MPSKDRDSEIELRPQLNLLISFAYMGSGILDQLWRFRTDIRLLIDSGAFTAWNIGKVIRLDDYCLFLEKLPIRPWRYFTLDVIGDPDATFKNYETMLRRGFQPIPIFTRGADKAMIDEYYKTSDIIATGMLGYIKALMKIIKGRMVHWLGYTSLPLVLALKPYSCDSSSSQSATRFGVLSLFDEIKCKFVQLYKKDFQRPPKPEVARLLRRYGLHSKALTEKKAWKNYHGISSLAGISTFRSHVVASLALEREIGTKYFIAIGMPKDVRLFHEAYRREAYR